MEERNMIPDGTRTDRPEAIRWKNSGKYRGFAAFLICVALLTAAFSVSMLWGRGRIEEWFAGLGSFLSADGGTPSETGSGTADADTADGSGTGEPEVIPEGAEPIRDMDLSGSAAALRYDNETPYHPDVAQSLSADVSAGEFDRSLPLVLILHTHPLESYLPAGCRYLTEDPGTICFSEDPGDGVIAVGEVLCAILNEKGIPTVHCTEVQDGGSYRGSYARAAEIIRQYLERYPGIRYVIDLHRDAVTTPDGEFVRSVSRGGGAQVLPVVGTDCNGTPCPGWQANFALAVRLRDELNAGGDALCRPVSLRKSSYNQEIAHRSLLLEIGTGANDVEQAKECARRVGEALAKLLLDQ